MTQQWCSVLANILISSLNAVRIPTSQVFLLHESKQSTSMSWHRQDIRPTMHRARYHATLCHMSWMPVRSSINNTTRSIATRNCCHSPTPPSLTNTPIVTIAYVYFDTCNEHRGLYALTLRHFGVVADCVGHIRTTLTDRLLSSLWLDENQAVAQGWFQRL